MKVHKLNKNDPSDVEISVKVEPILYWTNNTIKIIAE